MGLKEVVQTYQVLNIICYLRKSRQDLEREKRTGEDTLSEQRELMNKVLSTIELPYEVREEVGSGESIEGRPVFQQIMEELKTGKYQAIAVRELSRLSRGNYLDAGKIIELITEKRLIIITPYKVYDPRNVMDMKQIRFELFLAREEYEMIKERMVSARYVYAQQGKWVAGKSPYGYNYDKRTQKLYINDEEGQIVELIFDLFLNGLNGRDVSYHAIANYLTDIGVPTPRGKKHWSGFQVKYILTNGLYSGLIKFRTTETLKNGRKTPRPKSEHIFVENAHPAIIDKDKFEKVQEKIKSKLPQPHNPLDFAPHELAGICVCSVCGGKLIRRGEKSTYKKQDGTESLYIKEFLRCQKGRCMTVKYRLVEEALLEYLSDLSELDDIKLLMHLNNINAELNRQRNKDSGQIILQKIKQKIGEIEQRLTFIFDKYETGVYDDETFIKRKKSLEKELSKLKEEEESLLNSRIDNDKIDIKEVKVKFKNIVNYYHAEKERERKNEILRSVFDHVDIEITEKGRGTIPSKFNITPYLRYNFIVKPLDK